MPRLAKLILTITALVLFSTGLKAQDAHRIIAKQVSKIIRDRSILDNMKDSTTVYGGTLFINVKKGAPDRENIVEFSISNGEVENFFNNLEPLRKIDYSEILGEKDSIAFFYKIYILVTSSKYEAQTVDIEQVEDMLTRTFFKGAIDRVNLGTVLFQIDKKVYH